MSAHIHVRRFGVIASLVSLALILSSLLTACGSGTSSGGSCTVGGTTFDTSTFHLIKSGTLTVASDTTYPPQEFPDPNDPTKFTGSDIDLITEIATRICLGTVIQKADFDGIIPGLITPALGHQRYDLSISAFTINADRQKKVDMVPYFEAGESVLVAQGNPKNITSLDSLCGLNVSVQKDTVELMDLNTENQTKCGSTPINILTFTSQDDVILQLLNGRVDATYQDSPVTAYYVIQNPGHVQEAFVTPGSLAPEGIVMRKDNPDLEKAVEKALCAMVQDGTYLKILKQWKLDTGALPQNQFVCS